MSYLIKTTEVHRVNSENAAAALIAEAKSDNRFVLSKSSTEYKTIKQKGEIVEEYWICTLVKTFTDAKEPDCTVTVSYKVEEGYFPTINDRDDDEDEDDEDGRF